jgi:hypothetical protein
VSDPVDLILWGVFWVVFLVTWLALRAARRERIRRIRPEDVAP